MKKAVLKNFANLISQKKVGLKFSSAQIFVTLEKFRHLGPVNNLGQQKFGIFLNIS